MIDWLRQKLHIGAEQEEIERSDAVVSRIQRAVVEERQADQALKEDIVRHYPQTALAQALLTARDRDQPARAIREAHRLLEGGR